MSSIRSTAALLSLVTTATLLVACSSDLVESEEVSASATALVAVPASPEARKLGLDRFAGTQDDRALDVSALDASGAIVARVHARVSADALSIRVDEKDLEIKVQEHRIEIHGGGRVVVLEESAPSAEDAAFLDALAVDLSVASAAVVDTGFGEKVPSFAPPVSVDADGLSPAARRAPYWVRGRGTHLARSIACQKATNNAHTRCSNRACWGCTELLPECDCFCPGQMAGGDYLCVCHRSGKACGYDY